jgi:hypothetical protein
MLGFRPKLPINEEDRQWVNHGFDRLSLALGRSRMLDAEVILPTAEHFPDYYDGTEETLEALFGRLCGYMRVDRASIELEVLPDETAELRELLPFWRSNSERCAGLFIHPENSSRMVIAVHGAKLKDPLVLVATLAHELSHAVLLGGKLVNRNEADMEPLTDLLTVFLGFGVFTANTAARFQQHQRGRRQGWSMQRLGYLPEEVYGYALAKFAQERGEKSPPWIKHLTTNVRAYYKRSWAWLLSNHSRV